MTQTHCCSASALASTIVVGVVLTQTGFKTTQKCSIIVSIGQKFGRIIIRIFIQTVIELNYKL